MSIIPNDHQNNQINQNNQNNQNNLFFPNYYSSQEINIENYIQYNNFINKNNYINEGYVDKVPIVTLEQMEIILPQLRNSVCKINNKIIGTGFLCKIPFPDQFKLLPVLITNNHILNNEDIKSNKIINISFNDDKIFKKLNIEDRKTYTNENIY